MRPFPGVHWLTLRHRLPASWRAGKKKNRSLRWIQYHYQQAVRQIVPVPGLKTGSIDLFPSRTN